MYEDVMDESRVVKSTDQTVGKQTLVKVYFRDNKGLQYSGKALVPTSLLGDSRYGYAKVSG